MLDAIDALVALAEEGTMSRAAVRLRVSQSAVSKRVDALEARVGVPLVERAGRRVRLTPAGEQLVATVAPLCAQLRVALAREAPGRPVVIGSSPALLSSWLPAALAAARDEARVALEIHSHRGPAVVERLRAGVVDVAVVVDAGLPADVTVDRLAEEPMVVVGAPPGEPLPARLWLIESASLTSTALERQLSRHEVQPLGRVESFSTLVQLARAGFGPALVPLGIAEAMHAPSRPFHDVRRPIALAGRPGVLARTGVAALRAALRVAAAAHCPAG